MTDIAEPLASQQISRLGSFIHEQRKRARLSLRQLATLANVSNPYLSQIERGLHEPSVRVLKAIAIGLDVSADVLLAEAGILEQARNRPGGAVAAGAPAQGVEAAITADTRLTPEQRAALMVVYRSYVSADG